MPPRAVVLDDYQGVAGQRLAAAGLTGVDVDAVGEHVDDEDALVGRLSGAEIVVAMRERTALPARVIDRLADLRLLVTTGPGNAVVDFDAATARGICISGTLGTITPTSELTWGLILALSRHIPDEDHNLRAGRWQTTVGTGLAGKTLGVLGLGHLGQLVAKAGHAFRMEVMAWSQNLTAERAEAASVTLVTKDELFARADVLSVHLVLSDRTRGLVGEAELRAMKPTAVLVNTSRGPIVDEAALARALHEGWIAGAGVDVFSSEPVPADHPLLSAPNTILTPHLGYVTDDCYDVFFAHIAEDISGFLAGAPVRVLNPGWEAATPEP